MKYLSILFALVTIGLLSCGEDDVPAPQQVIVVEVDTTWLPDVIYNYTDPEEEDDTDGDEDIDCPTGPSDETSTEDELVKGQFIQ